MNIWWDGVILWWTLDQMTDYSSGDKSVEHRSDGILEPLGRFSPKPDATGSSVTRSFKLYSHSLLPIPTSRSHFPTQRITYQRFLYTPKIALTFRISFYTFREKNTKKANWNSINAPLSVLCKQRAK